MELTYIFHSGFSIEGDGWTVLIDFYRDTEDAYVKNVLLKRPGKLYILSTHFHEDHFNPEILTWKTARPNITYILSKDILRNHKAKKEDAVYIAKGAEYKDETLHIRALGSTDSGISFLIEAGGRSFFHAGDLNNWYWEKSPPEENLHGEKAYKGELKDILKLTQSIDVVFFPVDGRIGKEYMRGAAQFIERIETGLFVPMHFSTTSADLANAFERTAVRKGVKFWPLNRRGEKLVI